MRWQLEKNCVSKLNKLASDLTQYLSSWLTHTHYYSGIKSCVFKTHEGERIKYISSLWWRLCLRPPARSASQKCFIKQKSNDKQSFGRVRDHTSLISRILFCFPASSDIFTNLYIVEAGSSSSSTAVLVFPINMEYRLPQQYIMWYI